MSKATENLPKCENVKAPHPAERYDVCPTCGGYLAVLSSGYFRKHKPVFAPGDPRIAANLASK
ncbi:hypothetical protein SEA_ABBA_43 [Arthrobacter phage Abba]|uniref:Uncharacterized protein n=1 Tax=Arthrobacter phage Abba TaxID=2713256 RepID=A0A6G8R2F9_9CAUD|nr:hypothetical protein HYQ28_gp43 [Arthrobacter phage Abba]QIN94372.1 hypothetical protein SEA_ABBA_43 [Arthrobacter phage Abba]